MFQLTKDNMLLHLTKIHENLKLINYEIHDKELLDIMDSFEHWYHCLEGSPHHIIASNDHKNHWLEYWVTNLNCHKKNLTRETLNFDPKAHTRNPNFGSETTNKKPNSDLKPQTRNPYFSIQKRAINEQP